MTQLQSLLDQRKALSEQIDAIQSAQKEEENRAYIGRCFWTLNSYSGSDYWKLYTKIIDADDFGLYATEFEHTSNGEFWIRPHHCRMSVVEYEEISLDEFDSAYQEFLTNMHGSVANPKPRDN